MNNESEGRKELAVAYLTYHVGVRLQKGLGQGKQFLPDFLNPEYPEYGEGRLPNFPR